jgi:hypothetical protein
MTAQQLVTFMCDGVASRLGEPEFMAALDQLLKRMTIAQLVSCMCNGVASRLGEPQFMAALLRLSTLVENVRPFLYPSPYVSALPQLVEAIASGTPPADFLRGTYLDRKRKRDELL